MVLSLYWVAIGYLWNSLTALILPDMDIIAAGQGGLEMGFSNIATAGPASSRYSSADRCWTASTRGRRSWACRAAFP